MGELNEGSAKSKSKSKRKEEVGKDTQPREWPRGWGAREQERGEGEGRNKSMETRNPKLQQGLLEPKCEREVVGSEVRVRVRTLEEVNHITLARPGPLRKVGGLNCSNRQLPCAAGGASRLLPPCSELWAQIGSSVNPARGETLQPNGGGGRLHREGKETSKRRQNDTEGNRTIHNQGLNLRGEQLPLSLLPPPTQLHLLLFHLRESPLVLPGRRWLHPSHPSSPLSPPLRTCQGKRPVKSHVVNVFPSTACAARSGSGKVSTPAAIACSSTSRM